MVYSFLFAKLTFDVMWSLNNRLLSMMTPRAVLTFLSSCVSLPYFILYPVFISFYQFVDGDI